MLIINKINYISLNFNSPEKEALAKYHRESLKELDMIKLAKWRNGNVWKNH
jgi:hypothetical protein